MQLRKFFFRGFIGEGGGRGFVIKWGGGEDVVSPLFTSLVPFPEMPDPQAISYLFEILVIRVDLLTHAFKRVISNCKERASRYSIQWQFG